MAADSAHLLHGRQQQGNQDSQDDDDDQQFRQGECVATSAEHGKVLKDVKAREPRNPTYYLYDLSR